MKVFSETEIAANRATTAAISQQKIVHTTILLSVHFEEDSFILRNEQ
jgi:hypothetical protein